MKLIKNRTKSKTYSIVVPALAITLGVDVARISGEIVGHLGGNELTEGGIVGHSEHRYTHVSFGTFLGGGEERARETK